jgi:hypothetical protein
MESVGDVSLLPFIVTPKASKSEKNKGLDSLEQKLDSVNKAMVLVVALVIPTI